METKVQFSGEELELIACALRECAQVLHNTGNIPLLRPERETILARANAMGHLANSIRFTGQQMPLSSGEEAPTVEERKF
jgi:hypothetical protein